MSKPKKWDTMTQEEQESWKKKRLSQSCDCKSKNREKYREKYHEYRILNLERIKLAQLKYRAKNKGKIKLASRNYRSENKEKINNYRREYCKKNSEKVREWRRKSTNRDSYRLKIKEQQRRWRVIHRNNLREKALETIRSLGDSYVSSLMKIPTKVASGVPLLIESKREQIKISRQLKQQTKKQKQCTRTPAHCNKSETIFPRPLTRHGSTSLLSLELSSWSMPWVKQLIPLLSKSKPLN